MDRRTSLGTLTGALLAAPLAPEAQQRGKVYRIAWLQFGSGGPRVTLLDALYALGYIEGKNVAFAQAGGLIAYVPDPMTRRPIGAPPRSWAGSSRGRIRPRSRSSSRPASI